MLAQSGAPDFVIGVASVRVPRLCAQLCGRAVAGGAVMIRDMTAGSVVVEKPSGRLEGR